MVLQTETLERRRIRRDETIVLLSAPALSLALRLQSGGYATSHARRGAKPATARCAASFAESVALAAHSWRQCKPDGLRRRGNRRGAGPSAANTSPDQCVGVARERFSCSGQFANAHRDGQQYH